MFSLIRLLMCSLFGVSFFFSLVFCADAPPLPPAGTPNYSQLKGLASLVGGTKDTAVQSVPPGKTPKQFYPAPAEELPHPEKLPPPKPIRQASFTTMPLTQFPQEDDAALEEPEEILADSEAPNLDNGPLPQLSEPAPARLSNKTLEKTLFSRKTTESANGDEYSATAPDEMTDAGENTAGSAESKIGGWKNKLAKPELTPMISVGGSLLIVIAAFFLLAIVLRKVSPKGSRPLPQEAFECLGRYYLTQKHQVQLLRIGSRVVLVSVMPDGVRTLAEITDPDETVALLGLCRRLDNNSATEMFRKTVAGFSEEELSRPPERRQPVRSPRHSASSLDLYSDPDESLAAILAKGRQIR